MSDRINRQWIFARKPNGPVEIDQFEYQESAVPEPGGGEFLIRSLYFSCDPAMHSWMNGASYVAPLNVGDVMLARIVGQVVKSRHSGFAEATSLSRRAGGKITP